MLFLRQPTIELHQTIAAKVNTSAGQHASMEPRSPLHTPAAIWLHRKPSFSSICRYCICSSVCVLQQTTPPYRQPPSQSVAHDKCLDSWRGLTQKIHSGGGRKSGWFHQSSATTATPDTRHMTRSTLPQLHSTCCHHTFFRSFFCLLIVSLSCGGGAFSTSTSVCNAS